jgi:transposase
VSLHPTPIDPIPVETERVARAAFPHGTVITRLRDEFAELYRDEDFQALYPRRGQPGLAPWRLALVTVFQFLEHLSDRQAADAVRSRIDWKYALGLELSDPGFHFSVLTEFRARLLNAQSEYLLLDKMLGHFRTRGLIKARGRQRTDSTYVLGAVRDLHLLELVTETMRAVLNGLAAVAPEWLCGVAHPAWFERYARRAEDWRLPGGSKEKRAAYAQQVGADGFALLDALDVESTPAAARQVSTLALLRQVWQNHFERSADGPPRWRDGAQLPPVGERIQSPYDPQMHYSTKRGLEWSGYKVHVTETCDPAAVHLITHVETRPAMEPDMSATAAIHARLAARGLLPREHFVDSGYVDAELLVSSQSDHGVSLQGPVRGLSTWASRAGYGLANFSIDWEREQVTCPQGKVSVGWATKQEASGQTRIHVRFGRGDCGSCPARPLCTSSREARRSLYFHPRDQYEALNAARARMHDPEWKKRYRVRAGVEGTLSQGLRAFGMRRSRYIGLAKTTLQKTLAAVGINVARVVQWLDGRGQAITRTSRFARLAPGGL